MTARVDELLPVAEVAKLWHCSKNRIYDLIASGELRSVNLTRGRAKTRIPASALAEFVEKNTRIKERAS